MSKKRKATEEPIDETPHNKRNRSKPARYDDANFISDKAKAHVPSILQLLTSTLKKWTEDGLTLLSYSLQWDINLSMEELAAIVEKTPEEVSTLLRLIKQTRWEDRTMKKTLGDHFFLPKDNEHAASESLLDAWFHRHCSTWTAEFWRVLCTSLTPSSLNNSSEIALVIKDIGRSSDKEFRPIYEYIAMALDDPVSTLKTHPNLTPMQCGMVLEILHSLATEVKQHKHLKDCLHDRALAVLLGDWDALKMPEPSKENDKRALAKRVSLQSLNPFNMSKTSVPPVVVSKPTSISPEAEKAISDAIALKTDLRPIEKMAKVYTGFKTVFIRNKEATGEMNASFPIRKLEGANEKSVDLDGGSTSQRNLPLVAQKDAEEEEDDDDDDDEEDDEDDEEDDEDD